MLVRELIEKLSRYDTEAEVRIAQPTHNHWGQVAAAIPHNVAQETLIDGGGYAPLVIWEPGEDHPAPPKSSLCVVIS